VRSSRGGGFLALALLLGAGLAPGGLGVGAASAPIMAPSMRTANRRLRSAGGVLAALRSYPSREGWTNARYRRAARKRRNVARNRRAHRG
jgi:hypothetical protein